MSLFTRTDLLSDFRFWSNRPAAADDESLTDTQIYRLLSLAQRDLVLEVSNLCPRFGMGAPVQMTAGTDANGHPVFTLASPNVDEDGNPDLIFGKAELYTASDWKGRELYGSTYGGSGDLVFSGSQIFTPGGQVYTGGAPWIRYTRMPVSITASQDPTISTLLRPLIVPAALILWARRGGMRDERSFEGLYNDLWLGKNPGMGDVGIRGALQLQYRRSADAQLEGVRWWRAWLSGAYREGFFPEAVS